ncbi:MAG TPA: glycerol-3-phosphate 1-O-acyltransferase PlsY [Longimicrobiales bacterium]|nr:glycerol-3-phosphate 1-O-acyltransferase PlsY [Longimicrobiales bacterium]
MTWAGAIVAYLLGAVPSSYIAGRLRGIDLRRVGSGNLGATNAYRVLGARWAVPVLLFDIFKGWAAVSIVAPLFGGTSAGWSIACGACAVLGHTFSPFVGFRGGKGVATAAGMFLALAPLALLAGVVTFAVAVASTRTVSIGSLLAALVVPVAVFLTKGTGAVLWLALATAAFVFFTHRANIRRLLRGEEHRFEGRKRSQV